MSVTAAGVDRPTAANFAEKLLKEKLTVELKKNIDKPRKAR